MSRVRMPGRPGLLRRRRPVPVGTRDFDPGPGGRGIDGDTGLAGLREPRRPKPTLPTMAAALPIPQEEGAPTG